MQATKNPTKHLLLAAIIASTGLAHALPRIDQSLEAARDRIEAISGQERAESTTWDVTKRGVDDRPWLGSNDTVHYRLDQLRKKRTFQPEDHQEAFDILERMIDLGTEDHTISTKGLMIPASRSQQLLEDLRALHQAERDRLDEATRSDRQLRRWARELHRDLPPTNPNGGRLRRMLLGAPAVPFLYTWIWHHAETEDKGPYPHDFEHLRLYKPDSDQDKDILASLSEATEEQLLQLYAPMIVQQVSPGAEYPADDDRIGAGRVALTPEGKILSFIDPGEPVVYTRTSNVLLHDQWHRQLNYSLWYPEHPPMKSGDPEAGHTEGVLIRLTLDQGNHPILAETAFACGCFHRLFPVDALSRAATEQFGPVESGRSPLARAKLHHVDAIIPQGMGTFNESAPHPVVYLYSGKHFAGAVEFSGYHAIPEETTTYQLLPEETLEALPIETGLRASFFQQDGLVRGADRPEATMLYPTGFYHAGTPRIHDAHLIHFDQYDYNDPLLLEKLLRIPTLGGVLQDSTKSRYSHIPGIPKPPEDPAAKDDAPRAEKKAFFCPC